jgi:hypothetical protein
MTTLQSLVAAGTKLWLDSVDPDEIARNRAFGATGATSNPIIISDLIQTGRFDSDLHLTHFWKILLAIFPWPSGRRSTSHSVKNGLPDRRTG